VWEQAAKKKEEKKTKTTKYTFTLFDAPNCKYIKALAKTSGEKNRKKWHAASIICSSC